MKNIPLLAIATLFGLFAVNASAQQSQMVAGNVRAVKVEGTVWKVTPSSGQRERLKEGGFLLQGNTIETSGDGSVILLFDNGSTMSLRPGTKFSINEFLRDPFEAQKVDYKKLKNEPSRSITKVKVEQGAMCFDIPKLNRSSVCNIANPVGTAGIRGTAGYSDSDSFGVTEGSVQVQTKTGQTQTLSTGQTTGINPQGNFTPANSNANQNMQDAQQNSQSKQQNVPSEPFNNAPQAQPAAQGNLTPEQQESIEQAAKQGEEALVEAVKQIAAENPESAPAAAAAAAVLMPEAAPQIAAATATAAPQQAAQVAAAVVQVVPASAPEIAGAVAAAVPSQATSIAQSVAQASPAQAEAVAQAITSAVPSADANAVNSAAQQGAQESNQAGGQTQGSVASGGDTGGGGSGAPALPGGFGGGGGGGGGGNSGGGSQYGTQ